MLHVLFVRHGQSKNNILEAAHGGGDEFNRLRTIDPPLSELGERQAEFLGRHLGAQLRPSVQRVRVFCSSMTRAVQTSLPLSRVLGVQPRVHHQLHEVKGFYDTSGREVRGPTPSALRALCPGCQLDGIPEEGQGGETTNQTAARANAVADMLINWAATVDSEDQVAVIVSHNDFIAVLSQLLLARSAFSAGDVLFKESYWPMNNTGISHIVLGRPAPSHGYPGPAWLLYWNRSDHLSEEVRSGVQLKNIGCRQAAEFARVGQGGTGLRPLFSEVAVVTAPAAGPPAWRAAAALAAAALAGAAAATAAGALLPRGRR